MTIEVAFGANYLLVVGITVWSLGQLRRFLVENSRITDQLCLERFKALARTQMYLALAVIALIVSGAGLSMALVVRNDPVWFVVVLLVQFGAIGLGMYHKRVETRTRSLQASSDALAEEYRRVAETWVKRPLPDF